MTGPVIIPDPSVHEQYFEQARQIFSDRLIPSRERIKERFRRAFSSIQFGIETLRFGTTRTEGLWFWKRVIDAIFIRAEEQQRLQLTRALWDRFAKPSAWKVRKNCKSTLKNMLRDQYKIGLITNWDTRCSNLIEQLGIDSLFDASAVSSQVGYEKPDEGLFRWVLNELNVSPMNSLMIGDSIERDLRPADELNMETCFFSEQSNNGWTPKISDWRELKAVLKDNEVNTQDH